MSDQNSGDSLTFVLATEHYWLSIDPSSGLLSLATDFLTIPETYNIVVEVTDDNSIGDPER